MESGHDSTTVADAEPEWPPANAVDPRFTLANERTLLAWHRTSLAYIAAGLALPRLLEFDFELVLAAVLVVIGGSLTGLAHLRWQSTERAIAAGRPVPASRLPFLLSASGGIAAAVVLVSLIAG